MDLYMILFIVIMLAVMAGIILAVRLYQNYRTNAGFHTGKLFSIGQFMGALIGNHHLKEIGDKDLNQAAKPEWDDEMYVFSDVDKGKL